MSTSEPLVEVHEDRLARVRALLEGRDDAGLSAFLSALHPSDVADLVEELEEEERVFVLHLLPAELGSETLAEMEAEERPEELLVSLQPERILELLHELSDDDAADLIGELEPDEQARVLALLPRVEASELRRLLQYDEDSAGGIMTTELVAVSTELTAGEAISEVRRQARELGGEFYTIFVVDLLNRLAGTVRLQDLVLTDPATPLSELVEPPTARVTVDTDQEEVARIIARYNVPSIAVVGPREVLLGRITWDDVMDVMEEEQTEDLLRLAGVADEEVRGGWGESVRSRLPWLTLNMLTAALAAGVVILFDETIGAIVALAAIMPVIAALGGNAGTQALAVTVRRLALGEESAARRWGVAGKELMVGLFNGLVLGLIAAAAAWGLGLSMAVDAPVMLGLVVLMAMWGNLVVASIAGAFVPILLESMGIDPAVASSVFVTALTDLFGFFLLLGLATALLL
ncbi:MAG TPA: magnesium transporter [Longimicrobiales bacterium]|nr:magnesium transporter [Longimicrobiales bacterium]